MCLIGHIVPPERGEAHVFHSCGTTPTPIDCLGHFDVQSIGWGPVTLRLKRAQEGPDIVAESVLL